MQACNHIEISLKQKHITIHGGGIHILLNLISHCECMAQHKHEEQAILLGCLVKKIKKKKKKITFNTRWCSATEVLSGKCR